MTAKIKTITLKSGYRNPDFPLGTPAYFVVRVTDSVEFDPGAIISKQQVEALCGSKEWKVTVLTFGS